MRVAGLRPPRGAGIMASRPVPVLAAGPLTLRGAGGRGRRNRGARRASPRERDGGILLSQVPQGGPHAEGVLRAAHEARLAPSPPARALEAFRA